MIIDISGINKAKLISALFNNSKTRGFGFFDPKSRVEMSPHEAQTHIDKDGFLFDYLSGRLMKVDVSGDEMSAEAYDELNGPDAAKNVVERLRQSEAVAFKLAVPLTGRERAAAEVAASGATLSSHEEWLRILASASAGPGR